MCPLRDQGGGRVLLQGRDPRPLGCPDVRGVLLVVQEDPGLTLIGREAHAALRFSSSGWRFTTGMAVLIRWDSAGLVRRNQVPGTPSRWDPNRQHGSSGTAMRVEVLQGQALVSRAVPRGTPTRARAARGYDGGCPPRMA